MIVHSIARLAALLLVLLISGCAALDQMRPTVPADEESRIAAGLREALVIGSERASRRTGRVDGYLGNALIRIALPREFEQAASGLRTIGLGRQVDELEVAMNRAAETAAGEAVDVFRAVIVNMRPADVYAVLNGGNDAATRYLRAHAEDNLRQRYQPIVARAMSDVRAADIYREIANRWNRLPAVEPLTLDLNEYVTDRALNGLFVILAEEEQRIRTDPVARTTQLLREVFGRG